MTAVPPEPAPNTEGVYEVGWILLAAAIGFALFGLLGLVGFAAVAFVLSSVVGLGAA